MMTEGEFAHVTFGGNKSIRASQKVEDSLIHLDLPCLWCKLTPECEITLITPIRLII